jgi:hypothetical protein
VTLDGLMENIQHKKTARLDTAQFPSAVFQVYETCPSFVYLIVALTKVDFLCGSTWLNIRIARQSCPDV